MTAELLIYDDYYYVLELASFININCDTRYKTKASATRAGFALAKKLNLEVKP